MSFEIKQLQGDYWVSDDGDYYGPFTRYIDATDFMQDQIGVLYEYGAYNVYNPADNFGGGLDIFGLCDDLDGDDDPFDFIG